MADNSYSLETFIRIYNDTYGSYIQIGPDADGLDLIEIRAYDEVNQIICSMTIDEKQAHLIAQAINKLYPQT